MKLTNPFRQTVSLDEIHHLVKDIEMLQKAREVAPSQDEITIITSNIFSANEVLEYLLLKVK